jgi:hypothetical protein
VKNLEPQNTPPSAFRTDTIGIFAILAFAGAVQIVTTEPGSVRALLDPKVAAFWSVTLAVGGAFGLAAVLAPRRWAITAAVVQLGARVALGFGSLTYAVALLVTIGLTRGSSTAAITFGGIALMCFLAAWSIWKWIQAQAVAVQVVLVAQEGARHDALVRTQDAAQADAEAKEAARIAAIAAAAASMED